MGEETKQASDSTPTTSVTSKETQVVATSPPPAPTTPEVSTEPKAPVIVAEKVDEESTRGSRDRDIALAQVGTEKRLSFIRAWEESEKTKALNKAEKKLSGLDAWENTKKCNIDAKLKGIEEALDNKKAEAAEKMKNKIAQIHKEAEEKRAMVKAKRGEGILTIEEKAAKYRATGYAPKKFCGCMSF